MNKKYMGLLSGILLFTACKDNSEKKAQADNPVDQITIQKRTMKWESVASADRSTPVARHEAAFVRVDDKFYLLGGRGIRPVSIYDTKTQKWTEGEKPPIEMHHFQPIVFEKKIYLIAALTGKYPAETPTEHIYIYDPASDEWSKGDEIPAERRRGSTGNILHEGKVYIACGIKNGHIGDYKKWLDRYDPSTGEWEVLADAPRARDHFQAVLADGKIYAPAGRNSGIDPNSVFGGTIAEVDVYDIKNDTWQTLPNNIPTKRAGNAAALFNDELIVVGGESTTQEKAHSEVEVLDLNTHKWHSLPAMIEGRHGSGLVYFKDDLYIASGCGNRGGSPELTSMEKFGVED
ncbi:Kelch repeat-containing protein [Zobellia roscoffensis]|uniref:Kelch repeat-containing protein n=1 Tax=Zobellia roscoffensis TaxID=2779508 RepID=UPI00188C3BA4|nr:kelch repeat-containing protein [Zobellia roscoffensis]